MKVLWLCNTMPGILRRHLGASADSGFWLDQTLTALMAQPGIQVHLVCPGSAPEKGEIQNGLTFSLFQERNPAQYQPQLEQQYRGELSAFQPDLIHIWGTEYAHTLAMVNAAEAEGFLPKTVISIQGLCGYIAKHFCEGLPRSVTNGYTLRDFLRMDNVEHQRKVFVQRGALEAEAIRKVSHVIGRTDWDRACAHQLNPKAQYHRCGETLRQNFYSGAWQYSGCQKHLIFTTNCSYPIKGFHNLLNAFLIVREHYPDARIAVCGGGYLPRSKKEWLLQDGYRRYLYKLTKQHRLENQIDFLGRLDDEEMKAAFLKANVFALPSSCENSPNSLGEAMLLGVPCVAADVGGVSSMMQHKTDGFVYPSTAPYMLAHYIMEIFRMEDAAQSFAAAAVPHARKNHCPEENLNALLAIYETVSEEA